MRFHDKQDKTWLFTWQKTERSFAGTIFQLCSLSLSLSPSFPSPLFLTVVCLLPPSFMSFIKIFYPRGLREMYRVTLLLCCRQPRVDTNPMSTSIGGFFVSLQWLHTFSFILSSCRLADPPKCVSIFCMHLQMYIWVESQTTDTERTERLRVVSDREPRYEFGN